MQICMWKWKTIYPIKRGSVLAYGITAIPSICIYSWLRELDMIPSIVHLISDTNFQLQRSFTRYNHLLLLRASFYSSHPQNWRSQCCSSSSSQQQQQQRHILFIECILFYQFISFFHSLILFCCVIHAILQMIYATHDRNGLKICTPQSVWLEVVVYSH